MAALAANPLAAQPRVTAPSQEFGPNFGDDYWLSNNTQLSNYWHKLERESDRIHVVEIGKTAEGRPARWCIRRPCATRTTRTSIRC